MTQRMPPLARKRESAVIDDLITLDLDSSTLQKARAAYVEAVIKFKQAFGDSIIRRTLESRDNNQKLLTYNLLEFIPMRVRDLGTF